MRTALANHLRRLAAIGAALVLLGCGPAPTATPSASPAPTFAAAASPTPGPSVDAASVYAAIAAQVEQIRGLQPTADIAPVLLDADQLRANLTADFDRNNAPAVVRFTQELYIELGLLPPGSSLRDAYLD
ncbi:MAG: hypothetical protein HY263_00095, partial [Chloroflexi bacterium]|nr:hypothetical protein [Chloroflexota bacterium]